MGRKIFSYMIILAIFGFLLGYFIHGKVGENYISLSDLFSEKKITDDFVGWGRGKILNYQDKKNNIFLFALFGGVAGLLLGVFTGMSEKGKEGSEPERARQAAPPSTGAWAKEQNPKLEEHAVAIEQLEKYGELKEKGIITDEEFAAKKKQILGL